jgi:microcystin-dependent protein
MTEPFIGEIRNFGFNFAPRGWALCQGQLLPINQNTALFSLLGTMYGGDGRITFALPDLRGRTPIGFGQGPGLSDRTQGSPPVKRP